MFHNGYLVHPDIWMLWFAFFGTIVNTLAVAYLIYKEKSK